MSQGERERQRRVKLHQWAMRASDMISGAHPPRAPHLGDPCDYATEFMSHRCRCGHKPNTWDMTYSHVLIMLGEIGGQS